MRFKGGGQARKTALSSASHDLSHLSHLTNRPPPDSDFELPPFQGWDNSEANRLTDSDASYYKFKKPSPFLTPVSKEGGKVPVSMVVLPLNWVGVRGEMLPWNDTPVPYLSNTGSRTIIFYNIHRSTHHSGSESLSCLYIYVSHGHFGVLP